MRAAISRVGTDLILEPLLRPWISRVYPRHQRRLQKALAVARNAQFDVCMNDERCTTGANATPPWFEVILLPGHLELGTTNTATRTEDRAARPQRGGSGIRTWFSLEALLKEPLREPLEKYPLLMYTVSSFDVKVSSFDVRSILF